MKRTHSSVEQRRTEILKYIQGKKSVKVEELAKEFELSLMTVRRDLQYWNDRQLITRFHGGAKMQAYQHPQTKEEETQLYRQLIGRYAATKVSKGDIIFINGSRTAIGMLDYIQSKDVHVITNNARIVGHSYPTGISVTLTGGELKNQIMVGEYVMRNLLSISADKAFIGCAGIYKNGELCYDIPTEIGIVEAMISRTRKELYVMADHTKIQKKFVRHKNYGSCAFGRHFTFITDEQADPDTVKSLQDMGINIEQIGMDNIIIP